MPGLYAITIDNHDQRSYRDNKKRPASASPTDSAPRVRQGRNDSYSIPYPHKMTSTGYGVSEPQWTEGPPPLVFERSPYARVPLPQLSEGPIRLNNLLAFDKSPLINWFIDQPPSSAFLERDESYPEHYHWMSLPATDNPHLSSMTIRLDPFRSPIVVFPRGSVITIGDVLAAVYYGARRAATETFCDELGINSSLLMPAVQDYGRWVRQSIRPSGGDDSVCTSIRSYMNFRTRWAGLLPSTAERDVWVVYTKPIAG